MTSTHDKPGFTEGPWLLATSCGWRRFVNDRMDHVVEPIVQNDGHPDLHVSEADARLIAQAPKFYELLEWAVRTGGRFADPDSAPNPEACEATIKGREARELLREVRGE